MPSDTTSIKGGGTGDEYAAVAIGGGTGFAIGGPVGGAAGAAVGFLLAHLDQEGDTPHNIALAQAARGVRSNATDSGSLYIAHVNPEDVGADLEDDNPQGIVEGITGDPDILYVDVPGGAPNLVVEVETRESLKTQRSHTVEQLQNYRTGGFKRVLAVPSSDVEFARGWVDEQEELDGPLHVVGADNLASVM